MININNIRDHIVSILNSGLPTALTYHNTHHTLDVTEQCLSIAKDEGIADGRLLEELEIASLYHDTGFLYIYDGHEAKGCEIARAELPLFGLAALSIDNICNLIMATKVPQSPHNHLQKIICDADLDYLGRTDFFATGNQLRLELIAYNLIGDNHDWEERQLNFLQTHQYFTDSSRQKRGPAKMEFIKQLLQLKESKTT
jgi:predicted metal-dependent HD superfamily phosphohydrolase